MKNTELKRERDQALYAAYRKALAERGFATSQEAMEYVCKQPAPRFFIDPKAASNLVGLILNNVSLISKNACSRRLAWELYRRYLLFLEQHPGQPMRRLHIMEIIVDEPAPEWYIEDQRTRKIIKQERKKARARWERWRER